ncbi:MAG: hypothetical protein HPY73_08885 [Methanomassiliicoccales archaeon]|nr:MAG: hypothetical protein HPY73_08885 [Methanomassiliicoccales archaeon]
MMPDHCKDVSFREVEFELTMENITAMAEGKSAYTRTEFMVLKNGNNVAVVRVLKRPGKELFRPITSIEVISLPKDTVYIKDERVDVLNVSELAELVKENGGLTVVVSGMFNHVSFLHADELLTLRVVDVVPPTPSKLSVLVRKAMSSGLVELPIIIEQVDIDLNQKEGLVKTDAVMFPCRASGLFSSKRIYYLDETPAVEGDVTLIGCDLSRRIFRSVYGRDAPCIDICPKNLVVDDGTPTMIKCCKVKEGHEISGNIASVPWGATVQDVAGGVRALFER